LANSKNLYRITTETALNLTGTAASDFFNRSYSGWQGCNNKSTTAIAFQIMPICKSIKPNIKQYNKLTINDKAFSYLCSLMKQQYSNLIAVKFL